MKAYMKRIVMFAGAAVLALMLSGVVSAACDYLIIDDNITCYRTGSDANWCYYDCYCKTSSSACDGSYSQFGLIDAD